MEQKNYRRNMAYVQYLLRYMLIVGGKMYTVEDILALPDGERAELIDGEMFMMATPTWTHQGTLIWISNIIYNHIRSKGGNCKVCIAPFGVFIKKDNGNYLEPDISVICDRNKLDEKGCHGAPDWVLEIVSPSSKDMDYNRKLKVYKDAGVREYWIIDPLKDTVTVYDFENKMNEVIFQCTDVIRARIIEGLVIDFNDLKEYLKIF